MPRKKQPGTTRPKRDDGHPANPESDYLLEAARENWPHVLAAYRQFEDKKPVVLYDIQEKRIYAYPYADFLRDLSEKSQTTLKHQYERAIRDNVQRRLVSFSMDNE